MRAQETQPDTLARILDRLDALEKQNQALLSEVQSLRQELKQEKIGNTPAQNNSLNERMGVAEERIKEQAATKIEASQKFPISLSGMALFDAFFNTGAPAYGSLYGYGDGSSNGGATLRQSIIGLDFHGPRLPANGRVNGSLSLDFYENAQTDQVLRIRRGVVSFDWKRRSITVGQDRPIISPLQPTSFARVGIPPLDGAGNLWLWRPQLKYEERIPLTDKTRATLQLGVLQTDEKYALPTLPYYAAVEPSRPAAQGRVELSHSWAEDRRVSAGFGFHYSSSHIFYRSIDSRVLSADFLVKPTRLLELSGTVFRGQNFSNIGGGPPGFTIRDGTVVPIRGAGGWLQAAVPLTPRVTLNLYGGAQSSDPRDISSGNIARTFTYAGNVLYRISPNVVLGFEASQQRITPLDLHQLLMNHYDATVAYLF